MEDDPNFVDLMRRWENAGGVWRVLGQDHQAVTVALYRCDGGEEADRFVSSDPQLAQFLAGRTSSEEHLPETGVAAGHADDDERRERDRDSQGRARQARPRDRLGRPLSYGDAGVECDHTFIVG